MSEFFRATNLLLLLGNFLTGYLYYYMQNTFYNLKPWFEKRKALLVIVYITDILLVYAVNLLETPMFNLCAVICAFMLPLFLCFEVKGLRGLAYYAFYLVGTMLIEVVVGVSTGQLNVSVGAKTQYEAITPEICVLMNLLEIILVYTICKFGDKERSNRFDRVTLMFMLMPIISVVLIVTDIVSLTLGWVKTFNPDQFIRLAFLILVVNVVIFIILENYTGLMKRDLVLAQEKLKAESDADIMELAAKSMKDKLDIAENLVQQDRMMRHDRRHFEALLLGLLQDGKVEDAKRCLEERLALEPKVSKRYCENTTVNAAIGHYVAWAEKEDIPIQTRASIPYEITVDETELAIAISNLLENAIHACLKLPEEERFIRLTARYKSQLLLEEENSFDGSIQLDEEGHPCSDDPEHGIGTRSILAFINKTNSEIVYSIEGKRFKVRMIIGE